MKSPLVLFLVFLGGILLTPAYSGASCGSGPAAVSNSVIEWKDLPVSAFIKLNAAGFSRLTGRKMNLLQRVSFGMLKQQMKKTLKRRGDMTVREYLAIFDRMNKWLRLAILLLLAILLISVFINISKLG